MPSDRGTRKRFESEALRAARPWAEAAAVSVIAFYFFQGPSFSDGQAKDLALLVGGVALVVSLLYERTQQPQFERFWIRIEPNWTPLLQDFGLLGEDGWDAQRSVLLEDHGLVDDDCWERQLSDPQPGWHLLRDGIRFIALAPDLYYSNDHKSFFSKIDIEAEIEELRPAEKPPWPFDDFAPKFYLKERFDMVERREYWEFGLITLESIQRGHEFDRETKLIPAARLPKDFFRAKRGPDYQSDLSRRKMADIEKARSKSGWERPKREWEDGFFEFPFEIQHRYVTLRFGDLR